MEVLGLTTICWFKLLLVGEKGAALGMVLIPFLRTSLPSEEILVDGEYTAKLKKEQKQGGTLFCLNLTGGIFILFV